MLEALEASTTTETIHRYAVKTDIHDTLSAMGLDASDIAEIAAIAGNSLKDDPLSLLTAPFAHRNYIAVSPPRGRYSDGSFAVFYGALDCATAEAEVKYHVTRAFRGDSARPGSMFYRQFQVRFCGTVKDLTSMATEWTFLIDDDGYEKCNVLGKEAAASGLDGLLCPSARRPSGTTIPVFRKDCLSDPRTDALVAFRWDPVANDLLTDVVA